MALERGLGAATSPLKQLLESIDDETRSRAAAADAGEARPTPSRPSGRRRGRPSRSRALFKLAAGSRRPGADIEARVQGRSTCWSRATATRRPIDAVIGNLNEIAQNLILVATNPSQAAQRQRRAADQVASLRANAARLPPPFDHDPARRPTNSRATSTSATPGS